MIKIVTIIGARPQFVKAATISRSIKKTKSILEVIVHTGQHYDENMSKVFFEEMSIPKPDYNLGIGGGKHGQQTGEMLINIEKVLLKEEPKIVLVYGDTNSTIAGALVASKLHIPVLHIEAGLRSFNRKMPEEINRVLTDHISEMLFISTDAALNNLKNEGISDSKIYRVGDVMYDAAIFYKEKAIKQSEIIETLGLINTTFILATVHRAENTDNKERLTLIMKELDKISTNNKVILPLHPRTNQKMKEYKIRTKNITFIDPLGYIDMVMLEMKCAMIITDSGGIQKEAFFHKKPCITLRSETEWTELVEAGCNFLWSDEDSLLELYDKVKSRELNFSNEYYGNGKAASLIIDQIVRAYLN
ncbi:non-hydrolyzing UDP-N-acetylglucosamine 2-epimerase [Aquimarina sp. 2201CG14-23]|uniref:non-hydrolyzing UDP-N-acetylglucosamine 2-epimerase n=1 Tax=Aquimarina mycalae TaxID=3040073 RepID=UPI0024780A89|nr:UDP-N-acetylglucosamine 2-epimerase (non-hydrolyzing) [Aquimarina sp. 2201CG14-23]MDH7446374.1 UDP-N-acetylglucosamine 2-epimerase (non-hydrolyzing) [Aquimarina sp. 2201CG14-23]